MADSIERAIRERMARTETPRSGRRTVSAPLRAVTPELIASAFRDTAARRLLHFARTARLAQDSALVSYDAKVYQRLSAKLAFTRIGRERLVFRTEQSGRVRWHRSGGIWLDVTGARTVMPGIPEVGEREAGKGLAEASEGMLPIPYYPGAERLWAGQDIVREKVEDEGPIHPLAEGSEAYYTYGVGDSVDFRIPGGAVVRLRSLEIRPREPRWNLVVGTLMFEMETGQLVRAAFRFAVPMPIDDFVREQEEHAFDDVPAAVKPLIFPMRGEISAVTIEYGLYEGRFWLPRARTAEGIGSASFMRVPFSMEQSFQYSSVNGRDSIPRIDVPPDGSPPDSLNAAARIRWRDSVNRVYADGQRARRDSVLAGLRLGRRLTQCDTSEYRITSQRYRDSRVPMAVRTPCDEDRLKTSPDLPKSIYEPNEALFDLDARNALIAEALSLGAQPPFTLDPRRLPRPQLSHGLAMLRFNRVEGVSAAAGLSQVLGGGYTIDLTGRVASERAQLSGELALTRSNLAHGARAAVYRRLVSAGDWGNPLSFGSSLSGVLFGRDEGFYYHATGVEVGGRRDRGPSLDWRFFVERHATAPTRTAFSITGDNALPNISAVEARYAGIGVRSGGTWGDDPQGFRLFSELRLEGARAEDVFGRAALDVTATAGHGAWAGLVMLSGGSSIGEVPAQRLWYIGGTHTVRGQTPDPFGGGTAYWLTRAEVGPTIQGSRLVAFGDLGWAGDRGSLDVIGRPKSGVGLGLSVLDGLLRFDLAHGIHPARQWRFDAYVNGLF